MAKTVAQKMEAEKNNREWATKMRADAPNVRILSNGAEYDQDKGQIVKGAPLLPSQASALAHRRWDKARESFAAGVAAELRDTGLLPAMDDQDAASMYVIGSKTTQMMMDATFGNEYADVASLLTKTAGWVPSAADRNTQEQPGTVRLSASIPVEQLLALATALKQNANSIDSIDDSNVIDAEADSSGQGQTANEE